MLILLALLQDPAPPATAVAPPLTPMSLEAATRELDRPRFRFDFNVAEEPTFRVLVRERFELREPWKPDPFASSYMHTTMSRTHYEFLSTVTPQEFRSATLHPCCFDMIRVGQFVHDRVSRAIRNYREARAKRMVEEDLRAFLAATQRQ